MLTQFFLSINWVDVALAVLFVRTVFVSVKSGFIAEICRTLGTVIAAFCILHNYSWISATIGKKIPLAPHWIEIAVIIAMWLAVLLVMKLIRDGLMMLFKVETTQKTFDQYAAGILSVGRGLLVCSLVMFILLLTGHKALSRMVLKSWSHRIAGRAAINTYAFLHHNIVGKIFSNSKYNEAVDGVGRLKT